MDCLAGGLIVSKPLDSCSKRRRAEIFRPLGLKNPGLKNPNRCLDGVALGWFLRGTDDRQVVVEIPCEQSFGDWTVTSYVPASRAV